MEIGDTDVKILIKNDPIRGLNLIKRILRSKFETKEEVRKKMQEINDLTKKDKSVDALFVQVDY